MRTIKLTNADVQRLKDLALFYYKDEHTHDIDSDLQVTAAFIKSFESLLINNGIDVRIIFDGRKEYEGTGY